MMLNEVSGSLLGIVALGIAVASAATYWPKVRALRVPLRPVGNQALMVLGIVLAVMAFLKGPGLLAGVAASFAVLAGSLFLFFTLTSRLPEKVPGVTVGQPGGTVEQVANRRTVVLIKQAGQWKQVHGHSSRLNIAPPQ